MRLEHHLVGGYVCYISLHIIIIIIIGGHFGRHFENDNFPEARFS